jgi:ribosomal protein S18 acetylase RimI-like enzyme
VSDGPAPPIRLAGPGDAGEVARLLHDFNTEFGDPSPGVEVLTERARRMLGAEEMTVLLAGEGPDAIAELRFRTSLWFEGRDAYLEELYVAPGLRGKGIGRALLEAAMKTARERGAEHIELTTSLDDTAAIGLYESAGFTNREGGPDGPSMVYYERDL